MSTVKARRQQGTTSSSSRQPVASSSASTPDASASSSRTPKDKRQRVAQRIKTNALKRRQQESELEALQKSVDAWEDKASSDTITFDDLPLSSRTKAGLRAAHFATPTPIQRLAIPLALRGRDLLGSAKTGSGKTIAFLVPMLERLYRDRWGPQDGLGAIVLSPTRELAIQTFEALRAIGSRHQFSAGLVIGGKSVADESARLARMNILVATPGRLLQHLDESAALDASACRCLVLDEADRLLDMGFLPTLRAIIAQLGSNTAAAAAPAAEGASGAAGGGGGRQTMLFSATQSPELVSLARLSLRSPAYINVNRPGEEGVMPAGLEQFYAVVPLERKLDALWGFVKSHLKMKGVVFVSSCKQVRFVFETFKRLHPGLPLMHLHGKQKQGARLEIFQRFSSSPNALLICTDVASRGLDFPAVDWVVQLDCPEDVDMYIHRVGRTARYQAEGKGLCLLLPSEEEGMKRRWADKGIEVSRIKIKESKMGQLQQQMQGFAFREPEIKYLGQRAFISYLKSIHLQRDKTVFDLSALPIEAYAASLGLPGAPQVKFVTQANREKNKRRAGQQQQEQQQVQSVVSKEPLPASDGGVGDVDDSDMSSSDEETPTIAPASSSTPSVRTKYDRMFERKNQSVLAPHYNALVSHGAGDDDDDEDDLLTLEKRDHSLDDVDADASATSAPPVDLSKRKLKMGESRKQMLKLKGQGTKVTFDDDGQARSAYELQDLEAFEAAGGAQQQREAYVRAEAERMREADVIDRQVAREKRQEKKRKRKEREREAMEEEQQGEEGQGGMAVLGGWSDGEEEEQDSDDGGREEEEQRWQPAAKRARKEDVEVEVAGGEDEEELALKLLRG